MKIGFDAKYQNNDIFNSAEKYKIVKKVYKSKFTDIKNKNNDIFNRLPKKTKVRITIFIQLMQER